MIQIKNISKFYKDSENNITTGLKKVSMEFTKGEFVVIAGESGSGKSTLLNIISGMLPYEEGELYFLGKETSYYGKEEWEAYRRNYISVVYQDYNLVDSYTVLQNVETALLIAGTSKEEAREKALKYIDKVGLTEQIKHRASNLSSGQKQRLSIARALAKETDIIVADEPTGNLDEENGRQIAAIFKELAEDHLVIMVTHNYDQVKDLATRKIRLYNNELAEDEVLKPKNDIPDEITKIDPNAGLSAKEIKKKERKTINSFVRINKAAQPKRNFLMFSVYVALMLAVFVFMGTVISNSDSATSKLYNNDEMPNNDMTRIEIVRIDGKALTAEDIEKINSIKRVRYVDKYDYVNDINYYYREGDDHRVILDRQLSEYDTPDKTVIKFVEQDKYMKSVTCLTKDDILEGELATGRYEVVVPKDDKKLLGKTVTFYFECSERWKGDATIGVDMKVVGVADIDEDQCFFAESFCRDLSIEYLAPNLEINVLTTRGMIEGVGVYPLSEYEALDEEDKEYMDNVLEELIYTEELDSVRDVDYKRQYQALMIINEDLKDNEVIMSSNFYARVYNLALDERVMQFYVYNDAALWYQVENESGEKTRTGMAIKLIDTANKSDSQVIEVSEAFFNQIYTDRLDNQGCVYIEDYAYTDQVLSELTKLGYNNFSVFRAGATEYDKEVVMEKLRTICISLGAIVAVFFVGILIIHMMMKLKKKDFIVYDCLGMDHRTRYSIIKTDLLINAFIACALVLIIIAVLNMRNVEMIVDIVKHYRWYFYMMWVAISVAMAYLTSRMFNRYLNKIIK